MQDAAKAHVSLCLLLTLAAGSGCANSATSPVETPDYRPDASGYVTDDIRDGLDSAGRFVIKSAPQWVGRPLLTPEAAKAMGRAVLSTFYVAEDVLALPGTVSLRETAETDRGRPIDWHHLEAAYSEPFFAEPYLDSLGGMSANDFKRYGPQFLMTFLDGAGPALTLVVAAGATDVRIEGGRIVSESGPTFSAIGIPYDAETIMPPSPEAAVVFASNASGARVAAVPRLVVPSHRLFREYALWQLVLDRDVAFSRLVDGQAVPSRTIYVGPVPSVSESVSHGVRLRLFIGDGVRENLKGVSLPVREGFAVDYSEVVVPD